MPQIHEMGESMIRLLVIDDHELFREGISRLLQAESELEVVAHCGTSADAIRVIGSSKKIDVILLDWDLGHEKGADFLDQLRTTDFEGKVLLVTAGVSECDVPGLIRKGIAGIFLKHGSPAALIQGIRAAVEGRALFDQDVLRRALQQTADSDDKTRTKFSPRERQVLSFVFEGLGNKQIADRLRVSETSVKATLQQLFAKTGVRTRSQLVRVALEQYRELLSEQ
jgi:two-component system, NarL family, nitrate/nitrite response regulator NarL